MATLKDSKRCSSSILEAKAPPQDKMEIVALLTAQGVVKMLYVWIFKGNVKNVLS